MGEAKIAPFLYDNANVFEDLTMRWAFGMVKFYKENVPSFTNTIEIPNRLHYSQHYEELKAAWMVERKKSNPSLFKAIWKVMKSDIILALLPTTLFGYNMLLISTLMMMYIIEYIESSTEPSENVVFYLMVYAVSLLVYNFSFAYSLFRVIMIIAKLKGFLSQILFEKTLKLSPGEISRGNQVGKLSSLIASDLEFFDDLTITVFFVGAPLFFIGSVIFLWYTFGIAGMAGLLEIVLHFPIILALGKLTGNYRLASAALGDCRMKMITNLIEGIRIVKLYGWENPYLQSVFATRRLEILEIKKKGLLLCAIRRLNYGSTCLALFLIISVYLAQDNEITAAKTYSSIVLLVLFSDMVNGVGGVFVTVIYLVVTSLQRFTQILLLEEIPTDDSEKCLEYSLRLLNCTFGWKVQDNRPEEADEYSQLIENAKVWTLKNINFCIKPGELMIVLGSVGSGKTTLIMGLLNELHKINGSIEKNGNFAFSGEDPWIISGSIKENILMGFEYDEEWYNKVIKSCSLERDFDLFKEYRDETMVGDRGITLSGGQKARVSLARAVYANRDIYLLDDPLSAVDPEVCNTLFAECIKKLLSEKTVILATHHTHFVSQADKILILCEGSQVFFGSYKELLNTGGHSNYLGMVSQISHKHKLSENINEELPEETKIAIKDIKSILEEERSQGGVNFRMYFEYFMLGYKHWAVFFIMNLFETASQVSYIAVIFWVYYWSDGDDQNDSSYFIVMAVLITLVYILMFIRQCFVQFPLINSSENLHNLAISGIVYTKSVFFDKNPTGRILNRFSKDIAKMDESLINSIGDVLLSMTAVLVIVIVMIIIVPYTIIVLLIISVYFYFLLRYFAKVNRDLKKMEQITKSPIISLLNSSINGLSTIRCLDLQDKYLRDMSNSIATSIKTYISYQISITSLQLYLELGPTVLSIINIIALVLFKDSIESGLAGMSIALSITMAGILAYCSIKMVDTDNAMASPQRLFAYAQLEREGNLVESGSFKITHGKIQVINLYMKYRENYDYALKDLSFTIEAGNKVGIVGRTGAGKSSIMQTLFRLVNPEKGFILIDGQDYMQAGLHELRNQMSVIPQSVLLFIASFKDNLDPFHEHTDEEIIKVLNKVKLGSLLKELPNGLSSQINSKGLNLSAGQKQLLCLARAMLRKNKIVMVDEATANVDSETDQFIQSQLLKRFKKSTVLIIAHRLRTVIESDWVVVIDQGCTKEEGIPGELVKNEESLLLKMIMHTGPEESKFLLSKLDREHRD